MCYIKHASSDNPTWRFDNDIPPMILGNVPINEVSGETLPCWSLAALLNILHNKAKDIPSLSGGGYKAGKYTSDWCLDYEFENGDYQIVFADNPVDACYNMIVRLQDLNLL
jgi:hypothetical protein